MPHKILLVEDDEAIARFLSLELEHEGYTVSLAGDGRKALELAEGDSWDLILLDVMLPYLSGIEVCRRIKSRLAVPIIMVTARDAVSDRVAGLDGGADDYLTKPFAIEELLARIRVQLRRHEMGAKSQGTLQFQDLIINQETREVHRRRELIELTKKEFDLLEFMALNPNRVLTREVILERVWGYDFTGDTNIVDVYVRYLRAKVDDPFNQKLIHTVRGVGYILKG
ncbi:MAG: response regulator transcription factor [Firmicutes bacterium]|nr:response regulator transcription factor [Bacillota bacterium]MCL5040179.1 response regulator transcription factor [Bacillota bacterium]